MVIEGKPNEQAGMGYDFCIIGAGPAGLAAAYELVEKNRANIIVVDKNSIVGGLARTLTRGEHKFDVGPHRFYTKNIEVQRHWEKMLGEEFLNVERVTRIYYRGKYFSYPINLPNVLYNLGIINAVKTLFSFLVSQFKINDKKTFEGWIIQRFGKRLYEMFFKSYTEKVWGVPCNQIDAKWASQRIKGLSVFSIIKGLIGQKSTTPKSLVEQFNYPRYGAGQLYEKIAESILSRGATILLDHEVVQIELTDENKLGKITVRDLDGKCIVVNAKHILNSSPLTRFINLIDHPKFKSLEVITQELFYRDHITVNLVLAEQNIFADQWIYIHSENFKMARVTNYNNFSSHMSPGQTTSLCVEYFANKGDSLWSLSDDELIDLAYRELNEARIIEDVTIVDSFVIREVDSYPAYYLGYEDHCNTLRRALDELVNFSPIGRGGLFKYNNQDHAQLSGFYAVRNILDNTKYDLWNLNADSEYFEEKGS